jgi:signal transduction histidine kinase
MASFAETEAGTLWVATNQGGVWRLGGAGWEPIPGSRALASQLIYNIRPSPSGGMWIVSASTLMRVLEAPDRAEGWRVVETIRRWHGAVLPHGQDLLEEEDGTIWYTGSAGAGRVPAAARRAPIEPPPIALVEARSDGEALPSGGRVELPYRKNRLELRFAALSYRDPSLLRYRVRLGAHAAWSDPIEHPIFQFVDLAPGDYRAEIAATLDGERWSAAPAAFAFTVLRPWYLKPWALGSAAALLAALLYLVYRARLAFFLRLERQRARIAMDLHDEMGSGLGSIALLGSLAADEVSEAERRTLAARIAETATELGTSLGDIVWSLRPRSATLQALAEHLLERGGALFPGAGAALATDFPDEWPRVELSLPVRRNLQLVALEALHNAARHAGAKRVVLGLAPAGGRRWRLWVQDDGHGFDRAAAEAVAARRGSGGLGLGSMRRRAEEIGASFRLESRPAGGCTIEVGFVPGAAEVA